MVHIKDLSCDLRVILTAPLIVVKPPDAQSKSCFNRKRMLLNGTRHITFPTLEPCRTDINADRGTAAA